MPRKPKKPPWNALPPPERAPMPPPYTGPRGLTTSGLMPEAQWECLRCERVRAGLPPLPEASDHTPRCPFRGTGRDPLPKG